MTPSFKNNMHVQWLLEVNFIYKLVGKVIKKGQGSWVQETYTKLNIYKCLNKHHAFLLPCKYKYKHSHASAGSISTVLVIHGLIFFFQKNIFPTQFSVLLLSLSEVSLQHKLFWRILAFPLSPHWLEAALCLVQSVLPDVQELLEEAAGAGQPMGGGEVEVVIGKVAGKPNLLHNPNWSLHQCSGPCASRRCCKHVKRVGSPGGDACAAQLADAWLLAEVSTMPSDSGA